MAMNPDILASQILDTLRANMKTISAQAEPQDFQEELAKAVANGTITTLKASSVVGLTPAPQFLGTPGIGLVSDPNLMVLTAINFMVNLTGGGGVALPKLMESLLAPVAAHLATSVEVESMSGFGGQGSPPIGAVPPAFQAAILAELSPQTQSNLIKSQYGLALIQALAAGLGAAMAAAVPGIVPFGSTPPSAALLVAVLK